MQTFIAISVLQSKLWYWETVVFSQGYIESWKIQIPWWSGGTGWLKTQHVVFAQSLKRRVYVLDGSRLFLTLCSRASGGLGLRTPQNRKLLAEWISVYQDTSTAVLLNTRFISPVSSAVWLSIEDSNVSRKLPCRFEPQSRVFNWASVRFAMYLPT